MTASADPCRISDGECFVVFGIRLIHAHRNGIYYALKFRCGLLFPYEIRQTIGVNPDRLVVFFLMCPASSSSSGNLSVGSP